ncbi:MAG: hypothetical protein JW909_00670 [Planctomycetes bacterium]|nr:hypothetical protein [Planctomycetota bacterium]
MTETAAAVGLDVGSTATKGVLMQGGRVAAEHMEATGHDPVETARRVLEKIDGGRGTAVSATGYGRHLVGDVLGCAVLTEIRAHAAGARALMEGVRLVIDVGGQDTKVILLDEAGGVEDFLLNDRCASGTGRFIEMLRDALGMTFEEFDDAAAGAEEEARLTSTCAVFAQSEVTGLIAAGEKRSALARGGVGSIARRLAAEIGRLSRGKSYPAMFCGGGAELKSLRRMLERETGLETNVPDRVRYVGAIGAAFCRAT